MRMIHNASLFADSTTRPRAWRVLCWLIVTVFSLQLLLATQHHHPIANGNDADCVACNLSAHFSGALPSAAPVVLYALLISHWIIPAPRYGFYFSSPRHLQPLSHAPPSLVFI
jgi:hypothetical protein